MLEVLLVFVLVMCLFGAPYGYVRRADWGYAPGGAFTLLFLVVLVLLLTGWRP